VAASHLRTTPPESCVLFPLTISFLSQLDLWPQTLSTHILPKPAPANPLESALTKCGARVSKHVTSNPVESALAEIHSPSPLESALTKK
jgi:hypothetical protein